MAKVKKDSMGSMSGLKASNKRVGPVDPKQAAAYQRMTNAVEQGVTPEFQAEIHKKLLNANSREELDDIIRQSGL